MKFLNINFGKEHIMKIVSALDEEDTMFNEKKLSNRNIRLNIRRKEEKHRTSCKEWRKDRRVRTRVGCKR